MKNEETMEPVIGQEAVRRAQVILNRYKEGKANLERRVVDNEQWYKLRHWECMRGHGKNQVEPTSAWLFNAIANKHADVMDNFPSPNVLPREEGDKAEAKLLSSILPVVLEQSEFEQVYDEVNDYKLKAGTGIYGVFWDPGASGGLGDVAIRKVDILNLFWESGITDIQQSSNVFHVRLENNDVLAARYPQLAHKFAGPPMEEVGSKYLYDDRVDTTDKSAVVDWYYKKQLGAGRCSTTANMWGIRCSSPRRMIRRMLSVGGMTMGCTPSSLTRCSARRAPPAASATSMWPKAPRSTSTGATRPF